MPTNQSSKNNLALYRLRMGYSKKYVSGLLGHNNTSALSRLEQGKNLASLETALKLAVIYRIPVDFLYSPMHSSFREEIRSHEERLKGTQLTALSLITQTA